MSKKQKQKNFNKGVYSACEKTDEYELWQWHHFFLIVEVSMPQNSIL